MDVIPGSYPELEGCTARPVLTIQAASPGDLT